MRKLITNWKTTAAGIASIFAGVVLYTKGEHTIALSTIIAGIGNIFSQDAN